MRTFRFPNNQEIKAVTKGAKPQAKTLREYLKVADSDKKGFSSLSDEQKADVLNACKLITNLSIQTELFVEEEDKVPIHSLTHLSRCMSISRVRPIFNTQTSFSGLLRRRGSGREGGGGEEATAREGHGQEAAQKDQGCRGGCEAGGGEGAHGGPDLRAGSRHSQSHAHQGMPLRS